MSINDLHLESWINSEPKGNVLLIHGYPEHLGRHRKTIEYLYDQGWNVFAYDQRWHGKSPGKRGYADLGRLVIDGREMVEKLRREHPEGPFLLFGHSMGAIIAAAVGLQRPELVNGMVITAAGFLPFPIMPSWIRELISAFASYFPKLPASRMRIDFTCHDPEVVERLRQDPLYHHGYVPMLAAGTMVVQGQRVLELCRNFTRPALFIHGLDDGIADIQGARKFAAEAGLHLPKAQRPQVELIEVENAYHEVLNEDGAEELYQKISDWLEQFAR